MNRKRVLVFLGLKVAEIWGIVGLIWLCNHCRMFDIISDVLRVILVVVIFGGGLIWLNWLLAGEITRRK